MMMTTVRGRFRSIQATLTGDRDHPEEAGVEATIDAARMLSFARVGVAPLAWRGDS
jgi:polyisoprenoid-binding protein YceI